MGPSSSNRPEDLRWYSNCAILSCSQGDLFPCGANPGRSVTQLPSPQRHFPPTQHSKRLRPKTYTVAVYLVGAVIVLQVVMFVLVFWLRAMVVAVNVNLPNGVGTAVGNPNAPTPQTGESNNTGISRLPSLAASGLLKVPAASDALAQIETLNEEAQVFLHQNDLQSASDLLIKAEGHGPASSHHPQKPGRNLQLDE